MKKALILLMLLPSCSRDHRGTEILDRETFMDVYVALATTDPTDSTRSQSAVAAGILKDKGVTEDTFRATVEYYNQHPESWKEILDSVTRRMDARPAERRGKGRDQSP